MTRGWADPQNYKSLKGAGDYLSKKPGVPLEPGKFYTMTFPLQPDDQIIKPGAAARADGFLERQWIHVAAEPGTQIILDLDGSSITIPVLGGKECAAEGAGGWELGAGS